NGGFRRPGFPVGGFGKAGFITAAFPIVSLFQNNRFKITPLKYKPFFEKTRTVCSRLAGVNFWENHLYLTLKTLIVRKYCTL
ncbi:MAG: hypothetical protein KDD10_13555, partial [Phaeodactylibacter sp.]|nr:hypothetical protein [Phaeodactylibacter sp.]